MSDLEQVIEDSLNDAVSGIDEPDPVAEDSPAEVDTAPVEVAPVAEDDGTGEVTETPATTAVTPAANTDQTPKDPFEQLAGMPQMGVTGRENRIPYSRVKKITERAIADSEAKTAESVIGRKLNQGEKPQDAIKSFVEQIPQLTGKVQDYEGRLSTVGQFENVMANDPERFLGMLAKLPAYKQFFSFVEQAYNTMNQVAPQGQVQAQPQAQTQQAQAPVSDDMPQPDEKLPDGSAVYSMKGLQALMTWTQAKARAQAVQEASTQFEQRYKTLQDQYAPMLKAWQVHQTRQSVLPMIQAQIAEAKTWPLFNELEPEITKILERDKNISLEAAYRTVAFPRLISERNSMRQDIIQELKTAPQTTSVAGRTSKPVEPQDGRPRRIEDVIREQVEQMKGGGVQ